VCGGEHLGGEPVALVGEPVGGRGVGGSTLINKPFQS
jgi:hypothetical protein